MLHHEPDRAPPASPGQRLLRPLADFLATEAASGAVLVLAVVVALVWANSPWGDAYRSLWDTDLGINAAGHVLELDLRGWVSDGLMALFFVVVGLEIKRELVDGELKELRRAAMPAVGALGGMLVPALVFVAINAGGTAVHGWGVPMATDIAMALSVVGLLGARVSSGMKVFLLSLAIVDDIGAIAVIAVFYSDDTRLEFLGAGLVVVAVVLGLQRAGVHSQIVYVVLGIVLWLFLHEAGVHPTIAGVAMGLLCPARPYFPVEYRDAEDSISALDEQPSAAVAAEETAITRGSVSVIEWLEHHLHPWTSFLVLPLFALANAGVQLSAASFTDALASKVTLGVIAGLVLGKPLGIGIAIWLALRLKLGLLPTGATFPQMIGLACIAGIGFTVAILVSSLAFTDPLLRDQAVVGVLIGSLVAAVLGVVVLLRAGPSPEAEVEGVPSLPEGAAPLNSL
jgi:NhaA family Na+:H+ antiporter